METTNDAHFVTNTAGIIIVGSGNSACVNGAKVLMIDSADEVMTGGNSKYIADAMRYVYNIAVDKSVPFDPTIKDAKRTTGLNLPKSNWAQILNVPPFKAYPVTGGITFT